MAELNWTELNLMEKGKSRDGVCDSSWGGHAEENFQQHSAFGPFSSCHCPPPAPPSCPLHVLCLSSASSHFLLTLSGQIFYHTVTSEGSVSVVAIIALILNLDSVITLHREDPPSPSKLQAQALEPKRPKFECWFDHLSVLRYGPLFPWASVIFSLWDGDILTLQGFLRIKDHKKALLTMGRCIVSTSVLTV